MKFKPGTAKTPSYERTEDKRNKPPKNNGGNLVRLFKSILHKAVSTIALKLRTARENNNGDMVI
jgi:hypothetical protein